jgi:hypothetical protein
MTKNIKTDGSPVFLITINQRRANTNSRRNLRPTDTRLCRVWLSGSLVCPLKKIIIVISVVNENRRDNNTRSVIIKMFLISEDRIYPVPINRIFNNSIITMYLLIGFKIPDHLIKSLTAV